LKTKLEYQKNAENLIADEFSGELAEGVAYVAGHDEESRPVMVKPHFLSTLFPTHYY